MKNIRYKNVNVFENIYSNTTNYFKASTTSSVGDFKDKNFYAYYNKYLVNDINYLNLSAVSSQMGYSLYRRNTVGQSDLRVTSISYSSFSAVQSVTGVRNKYQYLYGSTNNFIGWFFPNQKSFIVSNYQSVSSTASVSQKISYYMTQQSYYLKVNDNERNNSYNCVTAASHASYTASQFIKGKPTYITAIGLYDDNMQCLAVAKLSKPIQKLQFIPTSFKVRFFN